MRILIADDDAGTRLILQSAIGQLGHECLVAEDGAMAWDILQSTPIDVVISDWVMPGLNGLELCRRVRSQPRAQYTYFMMLSSRREKSEIATGMHSGADDYLLKPLDFEELALRLVVAARITSLHADLAGKKQELERLNQVLSEQGRTDQLTQVSNRLRLEEDLEDFAVRSERYGQRFCVAMCDIDFFKVYNDSHGHLRGDEVLRAVAQTIAKTLRKGDRVYRYGGEEFLLILPGQSVESALPVLERIRMAVENLALPLTAAPSERVVTVSVGVAALASGSGASGVKQLLEEADAALYRAKKAGRNNVQVAAMPR